MWSVRPEDASTKGPDCDIFVVDSTRGKTPLQASFPHGDAFTGTTSTEPACNFWRKIDFPVKSPEHYSFPSEDGSTEGKFQGPDCDISGETPEQALFRPGYAFTARKILNLLLFKLEMDHLNESRQNNLHFSQEMIRVKESLQDLPSLEIIFLNKIVFKKKSKLSFLSAPVVKACTVCGQEVQARHLKRHLRILRKQSRNEWSKSS